MNLTHHRPPTRSFIIIIIVVLATVYTAFTLIKLQQQQTISIQSNNNDPKITPTSLNTDDWQNYIDRNYPLNILVPSDWQSGQDDSYSGFYSVNFKTKNSGVVKIFVSQTSFAGINDNKGLVYKTDEGVEVTKHDDLLYTAKVGEYYYTFDATLAINLEKELSEIVRLAKFD